MSKVVNLFDPDRYCLNKDCRKVDCDQHCWGCGASCVSDGFGEVPFCKACEIELNTDEDIDLTGFWEPVLPPVHETACRKRRCLPVSLEEALKDLDPNKYQDL